MKRVTGAVPSEAEVTAADAAYQDTQANLGRTLVERNREMHLVGAVRWHRGQDAELAADDRTTPNQQATRN